MEFMTTKNIEDRPALNRAGAYVILDERNNGKFAGKILVAYSRDGAGKLYAALWDFTPEKGRDVQNGYGYDKLSAAISGMQFGTGDREFILDCDRQGIGVAHAQFAEHGYILQWVV
jgi:hypothetical protein